MSSPYHSGERKVQELAGEVDSANGNGTVITDSILPGAMPFIAQQAMIIVSSIDPAGKLWCTTLIGQPGFLTPIDKHNLTLDTAMIASAEADPFWTNIQSNAQIGILAIELSTRRRFRMSGKITPYQSAAGASPHQPAAGAAHPLFHIKVEQAYPNCPKYIQRRNLSVAKDAQRIEPSNVESGHALSTDQIDFIKQADSFFVGTAAPIETGDADKFQCDASHRGGNAGFIEVIDGEHLRIPDYKGNSMFNTLGNIQNYPRAGLVFINFEQGHCLQLTGNAEILWDQEDDSNRTGGSKRFWKFSVAQWQQTPLPKALTWEFMDFSPHNPKTKKTTESMPEFVQLRLTEINVKSDRITQFVFEANDSKNYPHPLPKYSAGAHLPVEVTLPSGEIAERYYSLTSSFIDNKSRYEIAVQREDDGRGGSQFMHQLGVGDSLKTRSPKNHFELQPLGQHLILIAGGIGITPMLAMLKEAIQKQASVEIHYSAQSKADMAFYSEVKQLAENSVVTEARFYFSKGENGDGIDGSRVDLATLMAEPKPGTHLFTCGPNRLIESIRQTGDACGWSEGNIHFESFGPASLSTDAAIEVTLKKSGQVIQVDPKQTILDALIEAKVPVAFDCKRGECGMCATGYIRDAAASFAEGDSEIDHRDFCLSKEDRKHQMCVCVSRSKGRNLTLNL